MYLSTDKLMHFAVGLAAGVGFWHLLERYAKNGIRQINPISFLIMLIWGASGLFFFRLFHIPILSHQFFYMAVPDWDIPLYNWTHLRFLIHRSWLFHSVLLPISVIGLTLWAINRSSLYKNQQLLRWVRDGAMGLSVGMAAHLIWDALLSSTKSGFYIFGWNQTTSLMWLALNLILGFGIPFGLIFAMKSASIYE